MRTSYSHAFRMTSATSSGTEMLTRVMRIVHESGRQLSHGGPKPVKAPLESRSAFLTSVIESTGTGA